MAGDSCRPTDSRFDHTNSTPEKKCFRTPHTIDLLGVGTLRWPALTGTVATCLGSRVSTDGT
eukprot:5608825-Amphidinium_carterae.1